MNISRRGFLSTLLAGAAGLTLDPERLLWVPGAKTIFIPETVTLANVARGNRFANPDWLMREAMRLMQKNLAAADFINREYDREFMVQGARVGYTVNARLPQRYQLGTA